MKMSEPRYKDFPIQYVAVGKRGYPKGLGKVFRPPHQINYRGELVEALLQKSVAIVGSRKMTRYGREVIESFVSDFTLFGVTTISGFMYGVDTLVHSKTVEYGGKTVAVFGCGLDTIYPPENEKLYGDILDGGGVVISEYEPSARPHLWKFPQRNRIVAGLASLGVLVIEAGEGSGSLVTAEIAFRMGKPVFAVPGPINSSVSFGTNKLIREGKAQLVSSVDDILGSKTRREVKREAVQFSEAEQKIINVLAREAFSIDEIAASLGKGVIEMSSLLSILCLKGVLSEVQGKYYLVKR